MSHFETPQRVAKAPQREAEAPGGVGLAPPGVGLAPDGVAAVPRGAGGGPARRGGAALVTVNLPPTTTEMWPAGEPRPPSGAFVGGKGNLAGRSKFRATREDQNPKLQRGGATVPYVARVSTPSGFEFGEAIAKLPRPSGFVSFPRPRRGLT